VTTFIMNHGEKIVCAIVVAVCAFTIVENLQVPEDKTIRDVNDAREKIAKALENNQVGPDFQYFPGKRVSFAGRLAESLKRADEVSREAVPAYAFYPQPARPEVVAKPAPPPVPTSPALLTTPLNFSAKPDHGRVVLSCNLPKAPKGLKHFFPVRVEILRGATPEKVDQVVGTIELGPEKEPVAAETKAATKTEEAAKTEDLGATARSVRTSEPRKAVGKSKVAKPTEPVFEYEDFDVQARTSYCYRARLLARLEKLGPDDTIMEGGQALKVVIPPELAKVPGKEEGVTLYASSYTPVVSGLVPADILVRFAGVNGVLPDVQDPRFAPSGYGGNVGVRIWYTKKRMWAEATVPFDVGKAIAGKNTFRVGNESEELKYDTGLTLLEIKRAMRITTSIVKRPVTKKVKTAEGEEESVPVMDENGKPVYEEVPVENKTPTEVALMKHNDTGKIERFAKAGGNEWEVKDEDVKVLLEGEQDTGPAPAPKKVEAAPTKKAEEPAKKSAEPAKKATEPAKAAAEPAKKAP
jgi:hypothetical protein